MTTQLSILIPPPIIIMIMMILISTRDVSCASSPAPAVDCSTIALNMVDCLSFVTSGSTVSKPEGKCCSGLKSVLKTNPDCLCEAFKNSAQFGVSLNITKAITLPSLCKISAPSVNNCGINAGEAPALPPSAMPPNPIPDAPTTSPESNDVVPAPSPGSSAASSSALVISASSLVLSVIVTSMSFF